MSEQLKAHKEGTLYFCTLTVVDWIDLFTRRCYVEELIESLRYCQTNKGLELFAFVIMPSPPRPTGRGISSAECRTGSCLMSFAI